LITSAPDPATKTILRPLDVHTSQISPSPSTVLSHDQSSSTSSLSSSSATQTRFRPVLAAEPSPVSMLLGASSPRFASLPIGARVEVSAASFQTARKLGTLISQGAGGSALVVDYGTDHAVGNSFRVRLSFSRLTTLLRAPDSTAPPHVCCRHSRATPSSTHLNDPAMQTLPQT
jgi:NADH dehydrogenase [ubiquinone] 1 alpha subcomplex assembly factor 7